MNTRDVILKKALEMFNDKGIEYTGVRELAAILDIRVSNISYYFPSKDDLVAALAAQLKERNDAISGKEHSGTLYDFLYTGLQRQYNQYAYRCLFLSFVHIITQNPIVSKNYKQTEKARMNEIRTNITELVTNGYLGKNALEKLDTLSGHFSLVSRFWISEARVSFPDKKPEFVTGHYMSLLCDLLDQYSTAKGKKDIARFLADMKTYSAKNFGL